jgi:hypothetical protein
LGISGVNVELKTTISKISSVWVDVFNDHTSLIHMPVCQIDASSSWHTMQQEPGVTHLAPTYHTDPVVNYCAFFLACSFLCSCTQEFPNTVVLGFHALVSLNLWPFIMSALMLETKEISETLLFN